MTVIPFAADFESWRKVARAALHSGIPPECIVWDDGHSEQSLFAVQAAPLPQTAEKPLYRVPQEFMAVAKRVSSHRDRFRWSLLYRLLWRLAHGERHILELAVDPEVKMLHEMDRAVRRDVHKMRAFVRFREVAREDGPWLVAWFEPAHWILEANAPFFVDRFAQLRWSILTPDACAHWDKTELVITPGIAKARFVAEDAVEDLWRTYYKTIFNPGRVKTKAMQAEMPKKYWANLPEASTIPQLLREAPPRVARMQAASAEKSAVAGAWSRPEVPETEDLAKLRSAARFCQACPHAHLATQTVFGEGIPQARIMLLGEQPGDQEDLAGRPFIGPAGQLLDQALQTAGIERRNCYVTNAVKHFKWEARGKRRIHQKPSARDIECCRPWLQAELKLVHPEILVCLGGSAAEAVLGKSVKLKEIRGTFLHSPLAEKTFITVHPSSILRVSDPEAKEQAYASLVSDLSRVAAAIQ